MVHIAAEVAEIAEKQTKSILLFFFQKDFENSKFPKLKKHGWVGKGTASGENDKTTSKNFLKLVNSTIRCFCLFQYNL